MASLTGTKIKDTYDSLLKVSDNGALDGTLQTITDGLGNNSALSLSTAGASVTGTLSVSGGITGTLSTAAQTNITSVGTLSSLATSGRVGVGVSPFANTLSNGSIDLLNGAGIFGYGNSVYLTSNIYYGGNFTLKATAGGTAYVGNGLGEHIFYEVISGSAGATATLTERMRILSSGGITFNGDTSSANALDDYEEGTWTPTFTDTLGNNVTATNVGRYTKIGRQVTLSLTTTWSNKSAASAGSVVYMSGVPFNMNNKANGIITYYSGMNLTTVGAFTIANAGATLCYFPIQGSAVGASFLTFGETTNTSTFWLTLTYFV